MNKLLNKCGQNYSEKSLLFFVMVFIVLVFQASAQNLTLDGSFNAGVTDSSAQNYVSAVQPDGKILVGGNFNFVNGVQRTGIVRLNTDGMIDATFNTGGSGLKGNVLEIVVLGNGKILIGGSFGSYNGTLTGSFARLNSDGTLDTTFNVGGAGINNSGRLTSIVVQSDGKIIAAGQGVASYNGITANGLFRVNTDGSLDNSFISGFATSPSIEQIVLQPDGKIVLGLDLSTTYGGIAINPLIRINSNGTLDTAFNTGGSGVDVNGGVAGLAVQSDGKILIGGNFSTYNGTARSGIARVNTNGTLDTSFVPPTLLNEYVEYFAIQPDGKILAAGNLTDSNGLISPVIRLNSNGTQDTSLQSIADNSGYHVTLQTDGKILLTGLFNRFTSGETHNGIARFNTNGSLDNSFNPSLTGYGTVNVTAQQTDGKIIVGGIFRSANGIFSNGVARFNTDGTFDNTFDTGLGAQNDPTYLTNPVNALAIQPDGKILVGGLFGNFNGSTQRTLVRLNTNGSVDTSFNLAGDIILNSGANVEDILPLPDGKILIGGNGFYNISFQNRRFLRLNSNGSIDTTFNVGGASASGAINRIIRQSDGKILLGGSFTTYNGISRPRIARINADGTPDTTFTVGTGANNTVYDVALQTDGKIIIGGVFTSYNGTTINRIARLNADGTLDTGFNVGTGANGTINSLAIQADGKIIVGGVFTDIGGTTRNRLARLNSNGSLDTGLYSGFDSVLDSVNAILFQSDGKLLVGGTFTNYNGATHNSLLRLSSRSIYFDFDGDGKSDVSVFRPSNTVWYVSKSSDSQVLTAQWGIASDKIVPADYNGDGKTDYAVFRDGFWYILLNGGGFQGSQWGAAGDIPFPADFDGDGKADLGVFRNGTWFVLKSGGGTVTQNWGSAGDIPVVADYDNDGKADFAVYRNGIWYVLFSTGGNTAIQWGIAGDKTVAADYNGDGKADYAVFRNGFWYILLNGGGFQGAQWGTTGDVAAPADYDGDGKTDLAVFRAGTWYIQRTTAGVQVVNFGSAGDKPVPNAFVP